MPCAGRKKTADHKSMKAVASALSFRPPSPAAPFLDAVIYIAPVLVGCQHLNGSHPVPGATPILLDRLRLVALLNR